LGALVALLPACVRYAEPFRGACDGAASPQGDLDTSLPFNFGEGEPRIAQFYAYPYGGPQPAWSYRAGWDELGGCLSSAAPSLPIPARAFNVLTFAQRMASAINRYGDETTIEDLLMAGTVPETLRPASPVRASYYLGALLRCAEQGRLIARIGD